MPTNVARGQGRRLGALAMVAVLVAAVLCAGVAAGCSGSQDEDTYTIGIAVYDPTDPEMQMFCDYYNDYIAESFPVDFIVSNELSSYSDEESFIKKMKNRGAQAIIAFYVTDLEKTVAACEENEMYLVLGSSSISDSEYEAVKDNEWFLGVIGPDSEEEYDAGYKMAQNFVNEGAMSYLITSGGAADTTNYMHYTRAVGMLTALQDDLGLTYSASIEELAATSTLVTETCETDYGTVSITISPWYFSLDDGMSNLQAAFDAADYDALLSVCSISDALEAIEEETASSSVVMLVGTIDCFSDENYEAVETVDANGNSLLNYVKGKYASMVAPAFVAAFNAVTGHADVVKPDGEAFRLYQPYWTAASRAEYEELYSYTQSIYENAYSAADLMEVIAVYNEDANFEAFQELTESSDQTSVSARLG